MASLKNRPAAIFVTGTDTGVGKTRVSTALMRALADQGKRVVGFKPVASGTDEFGQEDVRALQAAASITVPDSLMNPFCFQDPIAPHLAAEKEGRRIDVHSLQTAFDQLCATSDTDVVIVEGAGGWLVPLNDSETLADFAACCNLPVLLVVGIRLGCLNHALLSAESIQASGLTISGWIANHVDPDVSVAAEQVATLRTRLPAPLLAEFPFAPEEASLWPTSDTSALFA